MPYTRSFAHLSEESLMCRTHWRMIELIQLGVLQRFLPPP
jgi:hypothetical protein